MTAGKGMGRAFLLYALSCVVVIGIAAGVFTSVYGSGQALHAVWISAVLALVVQVIAFAIARTLADGGNGIAGWGLGAFICLVVLIVYGFASRTLGLPPNAALLSLATYFSLTELIEAPFLSL